MKTSNMIWFSLLLLGSSTLAATHSVDSLSSNSTPEKSEESFCIEQNISWITSQEAKAIAEEYVDALIEKDFRKWQSLLLNPAGVSEAEFNREDPFGTAHLRDAYSNVPVIKKARLKEVDKRAHGYDARLEVTIIRVDWPLFGGSGGTTEVERSYWIQMLPDGKIKYDDIYIRHPVKTAIFWCHYALRSAHNKKRLDNADDLETLGDLKALGVPLFGYDLSADYSDQTEALRKLKDWLKDEGDKWDATYPKVFCPPEAHRIWIDWYSYRLRV